MKIKPKFFFLLLFIILCFLACREAEINIPCRESNNEPQNNELLPELFDNSTAVEKGIIRVKLTKEAGEDFALSEEDDDGFVKSSNSSINGYLSSMKITKMRRVFPHAGKFEARTRAKGLHLWYDIYFEKSEPISIRLRNAKKLLDVDIVEPIHRIQAVDSKPVFESIQYTSLKASAKQTEESIYPFNDIALPDQWHYHNTGSHVAGAVKGADINLLAAWKEETGKPNVIVAILDSGIDHEHEDLRESFYINSDELNGTKGSDDDSNGYIDDIYGYNFYTKSGIINPHLHGTHVAGIIAARNNNNIGVAGVAGGDGSVNSGVRIISCQIFDIDATTGRKGMGNPAEAVKYAADRGAVICQNSWEYTRLDPETGEVLIRDTPASMKDAIDYFIEFAGHDVDESGEHTGRQKADSPMKGGVVLFASGNNYPQLLSYPAMYAPVISVAAFGPDFVRSYYSTRGNWVSISAPGGDKNFGEQGKVLSTAPGNQYAWMQGSSMACPHVSGVAALILSKFGGQGYTIEDLKARLFNVSTVDINSKNTKDDKGLLGRGYLDAGLALTGTNAENKNKPPEKIRFVVLNAGTTNMLFRWLAVKDEDNTTADRYILYASRGEKLDASNYTDFEPNYIVGSTYTPGDTVYYSLSNLQDNSEYFFALESADKWNLKSEPVFFSQKTQKNSAPILTLEAPDKIRLTNNEKQGIKIHVDDPEGQFWKYEIKGYARNLFVDNKMIFFNIDASVPVGMHTTRVKVIDELGASASVQVDYEVYDNYPPQKIKDFSTIFVPQDKELELELSPYFVDNEENEISYRIKDYDSSIVEAVIAGSRLKLKGRKKENTVLLLAVADSYGKEITARIELKIVDEKDIVYSVYPIPTGDMLTISFNPSLDKALLRINSVSGEQLLLKNLDFKLLNNSNYQEDLRNLSPGTYVLYVEAGGEVFKKIIAKL